MGEVFDEGVGAVVGLFELEEMGSVGEEIVVEQGVGGKDIAEVEGREVGIGESRVGADDLDGAGEGVEVDGDGVDGGVVDDLGLVFGGAAEGEELGGFRVGPGKTWVGPGKTWFDRLTTSGGCGVTWFDRLTCDIGNGGGMGGGFRVGPGMTWFGPGMTWVGFRIGSGKTGVGGGDGAEGGAGEEVEGAGDEALEGREEGEEVGEVVVGVEGMGAAAGEAGGEVSGGFEVLVGAAGLTDGGVEEDEGVVLGS